MKLPKIIKVRKEKRMKQRLETVKDIYHKSETEKEAIQKATTRVIEEIDKHPDMSIIEFLKLIQEEEKLSIDIIVEVTKQLSEAKPEKTVATTLHLLKTSRSFSSSHLLPPAMPWQYQSPA